MPNTHMTRSISAFRKSKNCQQEIKTIYGTASACIRNARTVQYNIVVRSCSALIKRVPSDTSLCLPRQEVNCVQGSYSYSSKRILDMQQHHSPPYTTIKRRERVFGMFWIRLHDVCSAPGGYRKLLVRPRGWDGVQYHRQGASGRQLDPNLFIFCFIAGYVEFISLTSFISRLGKCLFIGTCRLPFTFKLGNS